MSRWIKQTQYGERGNCTQAAIASILGLQLDEVPNFIDLYPDVSAFWDAVYAFFLEKGYVFQMVANNTRYDVMYLASGPSPRGRPHMVVMQGDEIIHDPHPDNTGITQTDHVYLVLPIDPAMKK